MKGLNIVKGRKHIAKIEPCSFVDGEGVRCSVYVSGCPFQCKGCYNLDAQRFTYGPEYTDDTLDYILDCCAPEHVSGLSILGGEPFSNLDITLALAQQFRQRFGTTKTLWIWTGFLFEYLIRDAQRRPLVALADVIVDGPFIQSLYQPNLAYRGSLNQRIIHVAPSLEVQRPLSYIA